MHKVFGSPKFALALAFVATAAIACADSSPTSVSKAPSNSPFDGLTRVAINDTGVAVPLESLPPDSVPLPPDSVPPDSVTPPPSDSIPPDSVTPPDSVLPPPPPATLGYFHGTVMGQWQGTQGGTLADSMAAMPKLANIRVDVYPRLSARNPLAVGPLAASVLTDANGYFQIPTLAGGDYVVTFVPPAGSLYQGVWVTATANTHSSDWSWWVVLSKK